MSIKPTKKIGAVALAGALTTIGVWAIGLSGLVIPADIAVAVSTFITFSLGWLVPETAPVEDKP